VDATAFKTLKKTKESSEQHIAFLFKGTMYRKGVGRHVTHVNNYNFTAGYN